MKKPGMTFTEFIETCTWTCHICGEERPDKFISVDSRRINFGGLWMIHNVRYCNDNPECYARAKTHDLFAIGEKLHEPTDQ